MASDNEKAESNQKTGRHKQHDDEQGGGGGGAGGGGQTKHAAGETTPPDRTGNRTGSRADDGSRRESAE
jgi:hypothetical protein